MIDLLKSQRSGIICVFVLCDEINIEDSDCASESGSFSAPDVCFFANKESTGCESQNAEIEKMWYDDAHEGI